MTDNCEIYVKLQNARASGILWPKLRLSSYVFSPSRYPNTIYVKHSDGTYLGKIVSYAFYAASPHITTEAMRHEIHTLIRTSLSESLRVYGIQTGQCGCCGRKLTAADSIRNNIGPICAEKFGF
jgi:hypothetical protein